MKIVDSMSNNSQSCMHYLKVNAIALRQVCTISVYTSDMINHFVYFNLYVQSPLDYLAGSTLLRLLDRFALNNHDAANSNNITRSNIGKISDQIRHTHCFALLEINDMTTSSNKLWGLVQSPCGKIDVIMTLGGEGVSVHDVIVKPHCILWHQCTTYKQ